MAFDKGQLVMHQVQMKSKRMEGALVRFIEAFETGDFKKIAPTYYYALGCLGGDYLKKKLFKTSKFEEVVLELKENKLMKAETADKNIALWHERMDGKQYSDSYTDNSEHDNSESVNETIKSDIPNVSVCFGKKDDNGDVVPEDKKVVCEYADIPRPEGMMDCLQSFSSNNDTRRIIACY